MSVVGGLAAALGIFLLTNQRRKVLVRHGPKTCGILTGISYVSGLDYYKGINEVGIWAPAKIGALTRNVFLFP